ncbi:Holliday junction branch migration protein RuvA [Neisseriaceae bacterium B1]
MITQLSGKLIEKHPPQAVLDVHGVGYEVEVSMQTFYQLPAIGENFRLFTQLIVREDAHLLFGFADKSERATFRQLLKVSGIGAKTALGILSAMNADELAQAVAQEDVKRLSSAPGIGKKTAERMILELRGKLTHSGEGDLALFTSQNAPSQGEDIVSTLLALGYNEREARAAIKGIDTSDISEGVRLALKNLMK